MSRETGELEPVELFIAVLGASNYTYAEATSSQKVPDWIRANVHALEYFDGVPEVIVPDQLRSAVKTPCRYEPTIQENYAEMGCHYGTAIVPARPRKPKDKAKAEVAVQVVQRWILAVIRKEVFTSLLALNARIRELLDRLNQRPMKHMGGMPRLELFERIEKPALGSLPDRAYEYAEWHKARVNEDYHIGVE